MTNTTITIKGGVDKILKSIKDEIQALKRRELKRVGEQLVERLRDATPVQTGRARDGWDYVIEGDTLYITNRVEYMKDLNAGSSPQAPPAFIEQAVLQQPKVQVVGEIVKYHISVS